MSIQGLDVEAYLLAVRRLAHVAAGRKLSGDEVSELQGALGVLALAVHRMRGEHQDRLNEAHKLAADREECGRRARGRFF